jgi:hypothetical protein
LLPSLLLLLAWRLVSSCPLRAGAENI